MARAQCAAWQGICRLVGIEVMAKSGPLEFIQQVRQETAKVTWPSRREILVSTGMVLVLVLLFSIFFFVVDQVLSHAVRLVLGIGA